MTAATRCNSTAYHSNHDAPWSGSAMRNSGQHKSMPVCWHLSLRATASVLYRPSATHPCLVHILSLGATPTLLRISVCMTAVAMHNLCPGCKLTIFSNQRQNRQQPTPTQMSPLSLLQPAFVCCMLLFGTSSHTLVTTESSNLTPFQTSCLAHLNRNNQS